jgi:hypothetical protein
MPDQIILDLGEYGEIRVEPVNPAVTIVEEAEGGIVRAGRLGDAARATGEKIKVSAQKLLALPLEGLARVLLATLPDESDNDQWQLDECSIEFEVGLAVDVGSKLGAVAIISPNGGFKCVYSWKRRREGVEPAIEHKAT